MRGNIPHFLIENGALPFEMPANDTYDVDMVLADTPEGQFPAILITPKPDADIVRNLISDQADIFQYIVNSIEQLAADIGLDEGAGKLAGKVLIIIDYYDIRVNMSNLMFQVFGNGSHMMRKLDTLSNRIDILQIHNFDTFDPMWHRFIKSITERVKSLNIFTADQEESRASVFERGIRTLMGKSES